MPAGSFISVGADNTVRIWNIDQRTKHFQSVCYQNCVHLLKSKTFIYYSYFIRSTEFFTFLQDARLPPMQTNVFSEELKKVIYLSDSANSLVENPESQFFVILCAAYATVFYRHIFFRKYSGKNGSLFQRY